MATLSHRHYLRRVFARTWKSFRTYFQHPMRWLVGFVAVQLLASILHLSWRGKDVMMDELYYTAVPFFASVVGSLLLFFWLLMSSPRVLLAEAERRADFSEAVLKEHLERDPMAETLRILSEVQFSLGNEPFSLQQFFVYTSRSLLKGASAVELGFELGRFLWSEYRQVDARPVLDRLEIEGIIEQERTTYPVKSRVFGVDITNTRTHIRYVISPKGKEVLRALRRKLGL